MSKPAAKQRHDVAPMRKHGGTEKNEMDFALHQPRADAQGYNLSPLRGWLSSAAMSKFTRYANTRSCTISEVKQTSTDVLRNSKTHASGYQKFTA